MSELLVEKQQGVPEGYKLTEVGVIPEDWEVVLINDLNPSNSPAIKAGPFGSSLTKDIYVSKGYKVYGQEQVIKGDHKFGDYFIDENKYRQLRSCEVIEDDILLSLVGTVGRLLVIPSGAKRGVINPRLLRFRFDKGRVNSVFFKYLFESDSIQNNLSGSAQGGTMAVLNAGILKNLLISLPNISEQKLIATALSDVDELLASLEELIAKKQAIKTATMQQLLSGRTRLPQFALREDGWPKGYKPSELGEIPEDWEVKSYEEIFTYLSTSTNSRADLSSIGDYGYVHYGDIHTKWNNKLDLNQVELPQVSKELVSSAFIEDGDVIMADASEDYEGVGKSVEVSNIGDRKAVAGLHTFLLRDREKKLSDGFRGYLHTIPIVKASLDKMATGLKVYGISKRNLALILIPIPSKQEQTAIATILSDMDAELEALEKQLNKTQQIKQGMMQQLLTGKIRLVNPN